MNPQHFVLVSLKLRSSKLKLLSALWPRARVVPLGIRRLPELCEPRAWRVAELCGRAGLGQLPLAHHDHTVAVHHRGDAVGYGQDGGARELPDGRLQQVVGRKVHLWKQVAAVISGDVLQLDTSPND